MLIDKELVEIKRLYPGLNLSAEAGRQLLRGRFDFCALYDSIEDKFIINPQRNGTFDNEIIQDSYEIEVEFSLDYPHSFPQVREVGGRTQKVVEQYNIKDIRNLHVNKNKNNTVCLCPKPEEYLRYSNGVDIIDFFNALVLPYFFGLNYYEKNGQWHRDEYGHGDVGIFEFYAEHRDKKNIKLIESCIKSISENKSKEYLQKKGEIKGHWECICGSKSKFRNCHVKAIEGLRLLKDEIERLSIKL